jgi:hypothetical protein
VSEAALAKLLDRTHLAAGGVMPFSPVGPGYEVVQAAEGSGLLSGVE